MLESEGAEAVTQWWLHALYGEDVTASAMTVPWELRVQLYPELFTYGPAFREVKGFFDAVAAAGRRVDLDAAFDAMWDKLRKSFHRHEVLSGEPVVDWFFYRVLLWEADQEFAGSHSYGTAGCIAVVSLALSAEWLDESSRNRLAPFLVEMNAILAVVGLHELRPIDVFVRGEVAHA